MRRLVSLSAAYHIGYRAVLSSGAECGANNSHIISYPFTNSFHIKNSKLAQE